MKYLFHNPVTLISFVYQNIMTYILYVVLNNDIEFLISMKYDLSKLFSLSKETEI